MRHQRRQPPLSALACMAVCDLIHAWGLILSMHGAGCYPCSGMWWMNTGRSVHCVASCAADQTLQPCRGKRMAVPRWCADTQLWLTFSNTLTQPNDNYNLDLHMSAAASMPPAQAQAP